MSLFHHYLVTLHTSSMSTLSFAYILYSILVSTVFLPFHVLFFSFLLVLDVYQDRNGSNHHMTPTPHGFPHTHIGQQYQPVHSYSFYCGYWGCKSSTHYSRRLELRMAKHLDLCSVMWTAPPLVQSLAHYSDLT